MVVCRVKGVGEWLDGVCEVIWEECVGNEKFVKMWEARKRGEWSAMRGRGGGRRKRRILMMLRESGWIRKKLA